MSIPSSTYIQISEDEYDEYINDQHSDWRIHKWGGINLEVKCPTYPDRLVIVPKVNPLEKVQIILPEEHIICTCCNVVCNKNSVTKVYVNNCTWAFKIIRKDIESKQGGKVTSRILPIIVDVDKEICDKIILITIPNVNNQDDILDVQIQTRKKSSSSEPPKRVPVSWNLIERKKVIASNDPNGNVVRENSTPLVLSQRPNSEKDGNGQRTNSVKFREDRNALKIQPSKEQNMNLNYASFPQRGKIGPKKLNEAGRMPKETLPYPTEGQVLEFKISQNFVDNSKPIQQFKGRSNENFKVIKKT